MELAAHRFSKIADLTNLDHFNEVLDRIMVPRVVGTDEHGGFCVKTNFLEVLLTKKNYFTERVKDFIVAKFRELEWDVELDEFVDDTPIFKDLLFTNIIATLNPKAERFLLLACHYDSKYFKNEEFLGATDSAVPCAMLLNLAHVMSSYFNQLRSKDDVSIKIVFFDGEEAFQTWTATDSIYGARHLAAKWESENFLHRIDMLVLLDLLGTPDPTFYSFFRETENWYARMVQTEEKLDNQSLLHRYQSSSVINRNPTRYFQSNTLNAGIEDDHIPFLRRNVPILHIIPVPFPDVWHKPSDNQEAVDVTTVENISKVLRIFVTEYLHLQVDV